MQLRAASVLVFSLSLSVGCGGGGSKSGGSHDMAVGGGNDMAAAGGKDMTAAPPACSIGEQTGCSGDQKCIVTFNDNGDVVAACVANGTVALGAACTAGTNPDELDDNCIKGTTCDNNGVNATALCKKICTANADCASGDKCISFYDSSFGVCLTTCTAFDASSCPSGNDCSGNWNDIESTDNDGTGYFWCKPTGTGAADDDCETDGDCGAGLWCDFNFGTCTPACDDTHTCEAGGGMDLTCQPFPNLANGAGYCY